MFYLDDVILVGNSLGEFSHVKTILNDSLKIKDLGQLKYFLGLEITYSKLGTPYIREIIA